MVMRVRSMVLRAHSMLTVPFDSRTLDLCGFDLLDVAMKLGDLSTILFFRSRVDLRCRVVLLLAERAEGFRYVACIEVVVSYLRHNRRWEPMLFQSLLSQTHHRAPRSMSMSTRRHRLSVLSSITGVVLRRLRLSEMGCMIMVRLCEVVLLELRSADVVIFAVGVCIFCKLLGIQTVGVFAEH